MDYSKWSKDELKEERARLNNEIQERREQFQAAGIELNQRRGVEDDLTTLDALKQRNAELQHKLAEAEKKLGDAGVIVTPPAQVVGLQPLSLKAKLKKMAGGKDG